MGNGSGGGGDMPNIYAGIVVSCHNTNQCNSYYCLTFTIPFAKIPMNIVQLIMNYQDLLLLEFFESTGKLELVSRAFPVLYLLISCIQCLFYWLYCY